MSMEASWSEPLRPLPTLAGSDLEPEIFWGINLAPRILEPRDPYRVKSKDEAVKFELPSFKTLDDDAPAFPLEKVDPRLPESLLIPWNGSGSKTSPESALLWSRVDPGPVENSLFGPAPGGMQ
jgi:hypothetical protein